MKIGLKVQAFNYTMREKRLERGLSQAKLAKYTGIPTPTIGVIETLKCTYLKADTLTQYLFQIADFLDTPLDVMFPPEYVAANLGRQLPKTSVFYLSYDLPIEALTNQPSLQLEADPQALLEQDDINTAVLDAISNLTSKERDILIMRFGLHDGNSMSLQEVSEATGLTQERIRQIEGQALQRLRHPRYSRYLAQVWRNLDISTKPANTINYPQE